MHSSSKRLISFVFALLYVALATWGFWVLENSKSVGLVLSPWQTIRPVYIYIFWVATLVLGLLISFAKLRTRWFLLLLSLHGFLVYSYLPLTHPLLYGADGWRHLADVNRILEGVSWKEVSTGTSGVLSTVGMVAYSGFWGILAVVSKVIRIDVLSVLRWLQPVLTALFLPLLSFWLARSIGLTRRLCLLSAWYMFLPFSLQAVGAFTLPVSLWFLLFAGAFVLLIREFSRDVPRRKIILAIFIGLCFGYSLYPVLFVLAWGLAEVVRLQNKRTVSGWVGIGAAIILGFLIPIVEFAQAGSRFIKLGEIIPAITQLFGNLTGWYLASGPRTHDIATGNLFFNQMPSYAFVPNLFTAWRWWIVVYMLLFFAVALLGAYRLYRYGNQAPQLLALFGVLVSSSYIVGRYWIVGGQLLTRRMDAVVAFVVIYFILASTEWAIEIIENKNKSILLFVVVSVVVSSIAIAASYSLGPDSRTIARNQYEAMQRIAAAEKNTESHCVIADTYSLVILEALSAKRIVGGGFPINPDFSQPELDIVRQNLQQNGSDSYKDISYALSITGAKRCWYVGDNGFARVVGSVTN